MDLSQAINDPNRPLNVSPNSWMEMAVNELKHNEEIRHVIAAEKTNKDEDAVAIIDMGLDNIINGIKECYRGIELSKLVDMKPIERQTFDNVQKLFDTAIAPYISDIIKEFDKLEDHEE